MPVSLALLDHGEIELRLSSEHVDRAVLPLVVDPVVAVASIDGSSNDTTDPDVSYDETNDVWLVVYREAFSRSDADITCKRFTANGQLIDTTFADASSRDAAVPSIANNASADQFLIAWRQPRTINDRVMIRTRDAANTSQGPVVEVDAKAILGKPRVAGASRSGDLCYLLVYDYLTFSLSREIKSVLVDTSSGVGTAQIIEPAAGCGPDLRVTKSSGSHGHWLVCRTQRVLSPTSLCLRGDVFYSVLDSAGQVAQRPSLAGGNLLLDANPAAAGDGEKFLIVWTQSQGVQRNIVGTVIQRNPVTGTFARAIAPTDLSQREPGVSTLRDQFEPVVEFDGCRFVYVYLEGSPPQAYAATLGLDSSNRLFFHEGHVPLDAVGVRQIAPALASQGPSGGSPVPFLAVWEEVPGGAPHDIRASFFDAHAPGGGIAILRTACPLLRPPLIRAVGRPTMGSSFQVTFNTTLGTNPLMIIGLPITPVPLCSVPGTDCSLGVFPIQTISARQFATIVPCEQRLVGGAIAFQRLVLGAAGGCSATIIGLPFTVTDTLVATIL